MSTPESSPTTNDPRAEAQARQASLTHTVGTPAGQAAAGDATPWWKRLLGLH